MSTAVAPHSWEHFATRLGQKVARLQSNRGPAVASVELRLRTRQRDQRLRRRRSVERMTSEDECKSSGRACPLLVACPRCLGPLGLKEPKHIAHLLLEFGHRRLCRRLHERCHGFGGVQDRKALWKAAVSFSSSFRSPSRSVAPLPSPEEALASRTQPPELFQPTSVFA